MTSFKHTLWWCSCCWMWATLAQAQSVSIATPLLHAQPDYALTNYRTDTAQFSDQLAWEGLVYWEVPQADATEQPILELVVQHASGQQEIVSVVLEPLSGARLPQWHRSLTKTLPMLSLDLTPHWYAFRLMRPASLPSGYDVVRLGRVLETALEERGVQTFGYRPLSGEQLRHLQVDFKNAPGEQWTAFQTQYEHLKALSDQLDNVTAQQAALRSRCQPASFDQVQRWAEELHTRTDAKITADVGLFAAVEQLKITTETLPDHTPTYLKRDLHTLLLLDVALLEGPTAQKREQLLQRKAALLRQLSLYPSLKRVLQEYTRQTGSTAQQERAQATRRQALERVEQQFRPYRSLYQRYERLEEKAQYLDKQLSQRTQF